MPKKEIFDYIDNELYIENTKVSKITKELGTPCYVYSQTLIENTCLSLQQAFQNHYSNTQIFYAVKANSNLAILNLLKNLGCGFDIVSGGELSRVLAIGASPSKMVFSGVGKTEDEIELALKSEIYCFNVESLSELKLINKIANRLGLTANIALRINPDVDANSHPLITTGLKDNKFGIAYDDAIDAYLLAKSLPNLSIKGIHCHIGSQLMSLEPYKLALEKILVLHNKLIENGIEIEFLNMGGGLGIQYKDAIPPSFDEYAQMLSQYILPTSLKLCIEPGRSLVGKAGILVSKALRIKQAGTKQYLILDCASNDLMRPMLYDAWQDIRPVLRLKQTSQSIATQYEVVGPICESSDYLAKERMLEVEENDLVAIFDVGAYGFSMSSNYNTRPRCAEVLVSKDNYRVIRNRERTEDLYALETI